MEVSSRTFPIAFIYLLGTLPDVPRELLPTLPRQDPCCASKNFTALSLIEDLQPVNIIRRLRQTIRGQGL
jgi:hypothetical protein